MIRALVIAEAANPEMISVPLVGWSHAQALARNPNLDVHIVTQVRNREAFERAGYREGVEFTALDSEAVARPLWRASELLRGGAGKGWTTVSAFRLLAYYHFERLVWKRFGAGIKAGLFDVVHRLTPLSPAIPSPTLATKCRRARVPFVLGPLNGGLPWPKGFEAERRREGEWLSHLRQAYRLLPGYRSTRRSLSALLLASHNTRSQEPGWVQPKCVYLPENAIDPERFTLRVERTPTLPLRLAFVGRLVPCKGVDMLLEAGAPLFREGLATLEIIGDGLELEPLKRLAADLPPGAVRFPGWVPHEHLQDKLVEHDLLAFPSIHEFGGGVVLEAMALGLAPLVVDYGGPGELVTPSTGYRIPLGTRSEIVAGIRARLRALTEDPASIRAVGDRARERVFKAFTWDAKAEMVLEVYRWVLGQRERPDLDRILAQA